MKTLFYFTLVVRRIFILQAEKDRKKGMMDINLRSVAAVTSLRNICIHFDFPQPPAEHTYQSYLT